MRKYNKPKNQIPDMEVINKDEWYAITLNPSQQYECRRLNQQHRRLNKHYKNHAKIYSLRLYPELSSTGRLHFHGYIRISKVFLFYYKVVPTLISNYTIVIKEVTSEDWDTYCKKQNKLWTTELGYEYTFPLVYNHVPTDRIKTSFKKLLTTVNNSEAVGSPEDAISPGLD